MAVTPKQLENLKKGKSTQFNGETAAICGRKGAISPKRAQKRTLKECAELFGGLTVIDKKVLNSLEKQGVNVEDATHNMRVIVGMYNAAAKGNGNAARVLLELTGDIGNKEKQIDNANSMQSLIDALGKIEQK